MLLHLNVQLSWTPELATGRSRASIVGFCGHLRIHKTVSGQVDL